MGRALEKAPVFPQVLCRLVGTCPQHLPGFVSHRCVSSLQSGCCMWQFLITCVLELSWRTGVGCREAGSKKTGIGGRGGADSGWALATVQQRVTCPSRQAAAVAGDGVTAVGMAAVTALTAVQPKRAILCGQ